MKRLFSSSYRESGFTIGMLILRIAFGVLMIPHGYGKLIKFSSLSERFSDPFHIGSATSLILVIFAEFFCASLIVLGLLTRFATIPLIIAMCVALFIAHNGDFFGKGEMAALYLAVFILILFVGPGKASLDYLIGK